MSSSGAKLTAGGRSPRRWSLLVAAAVIALVGFTAAAASYGLSLLRGIAAALPPTPDLATLPVSTAVVDRDGLLLRPFTTSDGRWRLPVALGDVDRHFIDMLIAYEDQQLRRRITASTGLACCAPPGSSSGPAGTSSRAARRSPCRWRGCIESEPTRNLAGKMRQMVHADALEHQLSKDEILDRST